MAWNSKKSSSTENKVDRTRDALALLEAGVKKLVESAEWERWLRCQSSFHQYSFANTMLILSQCPEATRVAGYQTWIKLGRQVKKAEKAIWILAPRFFKAEQPEERAEVEGNDANAEEKARVYFRPVPVFDLSQTEGEDLPSPVRKLTGDDDGGLFERLKAFSESLGCPVVVGEVGGAANGCYSPVEHLIIIRVGLAPVQMAKTLAHEICHSILHRNPEVYAAHRPDCELEAESVAFVVLNHFGVDSGAYSFGYLASWQGGDEKAIKALKACAVRIQSTAKMVIDGISGESQAVDDEVAA